MSEEKEHANRQYMRVWPRCAGCGREIDPDLCGCGDPREGHSGINTGHEFVPIGCDCLREEDLT